MKFFIIMITNIHQVYKFITMLDTNKLDLANRVHRVTSRAKPSTIRLSRNINHITNCSNLRCCRDSQARELTNRTIRFNSRVSSSNSDPSKPVPSAEPVPKAGSVPSKPTPSAEHAPSADPDLCETVPCAEPSGLVNIMFQSRTDINDRKSDEPNENKDENTDESDTTGEPNQIEQLMNNPILNSINLPENFICNMKQHVDNLVNLTINRACEKIFNVNPAVVSYIDNLFYHNAKYKDLNMITPIKYTIKMSLNISNDFSLDDICAGIMNMGLTGSNTVISTNFETCIRIVKNELEIIYNRSYIQAFLQSIMNGNMEDVKKVLSEEELEKLIVCSFKELDSSIANINTMCTVCREEFCPDDKVRCLPCKHIYHQECVDGWLTSHSHKCPCCRTEAGTYVLKNN